MNVHHTKRVPILLIVKWPVSDYSKWDMLFIKGSEYDNRPTGKPYVRYCIYHSIYYTILTSILNLNCINLKLLPSITHDSNCSLHYIIVVHCHFIKPYNTSYEEGLNVATSSWPWVKKKHMMLHTHITREAQHPPLASSSTIYIIPSAKTIMVPLAMIWAIVLWSKLSY